MKTTQHKVLLIASGDSRLSANRLCWPAQQEMEEKLGKAVEKLGFKIERAHAVNEEGHGFIDSQHRGMSIFRELDPDAPLIVAEAVWQYSHHVLAGLTTHRGPILTVANWSGQWPGLVGLLNLNGSLTKAGVPFSTLWSETFCDDYFTDKLRDWLNTGMCQHERSHVSPLQPESIPDGDDALGRKLADQLRRDKSIMGVFDEGCMGMYNAIIPDSLLNRTGVFKERLSQSALYYESQQVSDEEAEGVFQWYLDHGFNFHFGDNEDEDLTKTQVIEQCRMYIAAVRIADDFGCESIGIQYQLGLKDLAPASDLVEGTLNSSERPAVFSRDKSRELYAGRCIPHFNEVDECAGLDALLINRLHSELGQPVETTLHDLRWGDFDQSGTSDEYIWVFEISGSAPAEHHGGWDKSHGYGQARMYFPKGGSTLSGVARAGEIIWSRIYIADDALHLDIGRGKAIDLPAEETQRRLDSTTPVWPIMHGVTYGTSRDQMMAQHQANHIQVAYATDTESADRALLTRAAFARHLGIQVNLCGTRKNSSPWD
jgi:L-fucose isomerase-like protein